MKVPVGVSRQPGMYGGSFVGGIIVQNHVHRGRGRGLCGQGVQESQELLLAAFRLGLGGGLSRLQGRAGLGALQGLDLPLLIQGQHQGMRRQIQIQADHVPGHAREVGVRGNLELAAAMRGPAHASVRCGARWCGPGPPPVPYAGWSSGRLRPGAAAACGSALPASARPIA